MTQEAAMPVRPLGSQAWATSTRSPPMIRQSPSMPDDLQQLGHPQAARLGRAGARRLGRDPARRRRSSRRADGRAARGSRPRTTSTGWPASDREEVAAPVHVLLARARAHARSGTRGPGRPRPSPAPWPRRSCSARRGTPHGCRGARRAAGCAAPGTTGASASMTGTVAVWSPPSMNGMSPGRHQRGDLLAGGVELLARRHARRAARSRRCRPAAGLPGRARAHGE